jgi:uncharacterized protein
MSLRGGGSLDNSALEARSDVLTFSTEPLSAAVEVAGIPVVRVHLHSDNAYFDVFARLCDVSPDGRSANLTDQVFRSPPAAVIPGEIWQVDIPLTDVAHVFRSGHRIRLQLSGGAHPRFSRNLGTDADPVRGTKTAPVTHHVQHSAACPSALILPVVAATAEAVVTATAAEVAVSPAPAP